MTKLFKCPTYFHQSLESHVAMLCLGSCELSRQMHSAMGIGTLRRVYHLFSKFLNIHFNNVTISWKSNFYIIIIYNFGDHTYRSTADAVFKLRMLAEMDFEKNNFGKQFRIYNILPINSHKKLPRISAI